MFRLRGKGVKALRGNSTGDLMCKVIVETPVNLSQKQEDLLNNFYNSIDQHQKHLPRYRYWFDNVKKFFSGNS